jgi:enoyl-CoA hydratase/carnithine racemase
MDFVQWSVQEGIADVRLERAPVNAIDDRVVEELSACFRWIAEDAQVRGTVLSGSGKFFSFGFDIPRFLGDSKEAFSSFLTRFTTLYRDLFSHPKPIVAALNGHAVAGGCMLATACDARIMVSGKAKIGLNEIGFGSSVFAGSVRILIFLLGERRAQEILYGARLYSAGEALDLGLIDAVAEEAALRPAAHQLARTLATRDPAAFRSLKTLLRKPAIDEMIAREPESIREFVEIWYSERTWKNLQEIKIRG